MSWRDDSRLDAMVRSALRNGPIRPTPFGLHGRIWRRLEIAAMVERERKRFRAAVRRSCAALAVLAAALGGIAWLWDPLASVTDEMPGSLGLVDYLRVYLSANAMQVVANLGAWIGGAATVAALLVVLLGGGSRLGHLIRRF